MKTTTVLVLVLITLSLVATGCATTGIGDKTTTNEVGGDPSPNVKWEDGVTEEDNDGRTIWIVGCHQLLGPAQEAFAWLWAEKQSAKVFDTFQEKASFWYSTPKRVWSNDHAVIEGQLFCCIMKQATRRGHK